MQTNLLLINIRIHNLIKKIHIFVKILSEFNNNLFNVILESYLHEPPKDHQQDAKSHLQKAPQQYVDQT